jgi:hypothetical protein
LLTGSDVLFDPDERFFAIVEWLGLDLGRQGVDLGERLVDVVELDLGWVVRKGDHDLASI